MINKRNQIWTFCRSRAVLFILLLGLCTWFYPGKIVFAQGMGSGVRVELIGPELIRTEPEKVATLVFQVTNTGGETREFIGEVNLPDQSWLITKEFPFALDAGESDIRLVSFSIPLEVAAGRYQIAYTVRDRILPSISDECTANVEVLSLARLKVSLIKAPPYVIAGKSYQSQFVIINGGNAASDIVLEIESEREYPASADVSQFHLEPGELQNVTITVETDPDISQKVKHRLKLTAKALHIEEGVAAAVSSVEVIPLIVGAEDLFHRLPGELTLSGVLGKNEELTFSLQMEISGSGTLDEEGTKELDFLFKVRPWQGLLSELPFELREELLLSYRTKKMEIHLGDGNYSLSPLTEHSYYGRGIEGRLNLGVLNLRAYSQESRYWIEPKLKETAYQASCQLGEKYEVILNYLKKKETNPPADFSGELADDFIWSLQARVQPADNIGLDLEYARSQKEEEVSESDVAYRMKVGGCYREIYSYELESIWAGPHYAGFYSNVDLKSGKLSFNLWKNLQLNAYYCDRRENLELDPTLSSALHEGNLLLGLRYKFTPITQLSLEYKEHNREDYLWSSFNYKEDSLGVRVEQNFKKLNLQGLAELGKNRDNLTGQLNNLEKYRVSLIYRPTKRQYYNGYYQIEDTYDFLDNHQYKIVKGFNAELEMSDKTSLYANFQTNEEGTLIRNLREIAFKYELPKGNKVALRVQQTLSAGSDYTTYFLEYTIPFRVPISRKTNIGVIKGRVYDLENEGKGMAGAILRIDGQAIVTDENGNFTFPSLKSGTYHLWVDRASIGLDRVTDQRLPMEVNVEGGKETLLNLGVVRAASLSGRVVVYRFKDETGISVLPESVSEEEREVVESYELANTVVELTNGSDIQRCITDNKGCFRFQDLRPGRWALKVYGGNVPEFHYLEKDTFAFELKAGDKEEIEIRVLPRLRPIQIIEEGGEVSLEE